MARAGLSAHLGRDLQSQKIMTTTATLTGAHLRTYHTIFQHPASHNLAWHDVHALFRQLGQLDEEPNGKWKFTRNGQILALHPPSTKDVADTDELISLRHFLTRSEPAGVAARPEAEWLVVIDHREARIYRSAAPGAVAQQIRPHAPEEFFRHAPHSKEFSRGQEKPDPASFFEPVAGVLNGAGKILVFGCGTGTGSEMDQFTAWVKLHRPELAKRIVGSQVIDEHHLTEGQLLAKARDFFAGHTARSA
jgi:hypothetical protein